MATDGKRAWPASPSENGKCDPVREYFEGFATGTARTSASHPGGVVDQVNEQQHGNGMDDGADQAVDSFNYADEPTFADDSADEYYNDDEPLYPVEMGWGEIVNYETEVVTPGMLRQNDVCSDRPDALDNADEALVPAHQARRCTHNEAHGDYLGGHRRLPADQWRTGGIQSEGPRWRRTQDPARARGILDRSCPRRRLSSKSSKPAATIYSTRSASQSQAVYSLYSTPCRILEVQ